MKANRNKSDSTVPQVAQDNINAIMRIEQEFLRQRSGVDRLSDRISRFVGSPSFIIAQLILSAGWVLLNTLAPERAFDPFPFGLLSIFVGVEAIFLTTFVLMSQNRQAHQDDHWAHLHLQIALLAEQENAKILQMLRSIAARLGLQKQNRDAELTAMAGKKSIGELAEHLAEKLERTRDQEQPLPGG